jgi:hypothetical protein
MASPSSLTTRIGFGAQTVKGTFPTTNIQLARGISAESMPQPDYIENENQMIGVHERATSAQSVAERSSFSIPVDYDLGLYPKSLAHLLFGVGFVPGTGVTTSGVTVHKLVKSNQADAPYLTNYLRAGSGADKFTRQIQDVRFNQLVITLTRTSGATVRATGMGLNETVVADGGYSVIAEADTQFQPFLGGFLWNTAVGSDYNFGSFREHVITIDRPIEEDDQYLHEFSRNDNQEMSFGVSGEIRGLEFNPAVYNELYYGGVGTLTGASLSVTSVLTGLTMELNTSRVIPTTLTPYKFIMNIPKAEIRMTNFRFQGNEIVRADARWRMIDDAATPPIRVELHNDVTSYPHNNALFLAAGGSAWTLPDATP